MCTLYYINMMSNMMNKFACYFKCDSFHLILENYQCYS